MICGMAQNFKLCLSLIRRCSQAFQLCSQAGRFGFSSIGTFLFRIGTFLFRISTFLFRIGTFLFRIGAVLACQHALAIGFKETQPVVLCTLKSPLLESQPQLQAVGPQPTALILGSRDILTFFQLPSL